MPLALQALLPLLVLVLAAAMVSLRPRHERNGWIASAATGIAALMSLVELLRLAPGEHVDVPYLTTFPYADLLIRLDGLSLSFATITLITASLLMLVRQWDGGDRRDPWVGWLLTSAAACAVILAGNLVLLYILLQGLTLAWSGALDETARRRRALRLTLQVADIGLLLAAAGAIQSVGTSSYSGVPSDTFGLASFWLMLLPVLVRVAALVTGARRGPAAVAFGPAIAWLAPAAYMLVRLLALMGGRLPDRPTAVALFGLASAIAILLALGALVTRDLGRITSLLLTAQAALALALSSGSEPLLTVASCWFWLLLVPLAGLVGVRTSAHRDAETMVRLQLAMIPASIAFTGIWLGALTLNQLGLAFAVLPIAVTIVLSAAACLRALPRPRSLSRHPITAWAIGLLVLAAFPIIAVNVLVIPTASTVRLLPAGTISATFFGLSTTFGSWPALPVFIATLLALTLAGRLIDVAVAVRFLNRVPSVRVPQLPSRVRAWRLVAGRSKPGALGGRWPRVALWSAFAVILIVALARP